MGRIYRAAKYIRTSCPEDETDSRDSVANQSRLIDNYLKDHPEIVVVAERIERIQRGVF